ncbi:MAG: adenosine kinase [Silvanigrellales bacterium]|nr:adenosine kinase [Silvanigrellales bacterium]
MDFLTAEQRSRPLDVTGLENALVDLLVRAEDSDLRSLGMSKGTMQLVSAEEQVRVLANLGKLTAEVELGGSAANAIRGLAVLGARTSYSSCVGHDEYGKSFSSRLEELGIRNMLAQVESAPTGTCLVVVTPDGERTLNTHLGACLHYAKAHVPEEDIRKSKVFFTTGYVWDTPSQIDAVSQALQVAKNNNVKVAFDVADPFVVQRWGAQLREVLETSAHVVFANALEAQMLVGVQGEDAARILGRKIEIVVVKDGAKGAWVAHRGDILHIPTNKVNVVDTTGAGDMFAGGFLYGLTHGCTLETCGRLATLLAADTITHMGVRLSKDIPLRAKALLSH